MNNEVIYTEFRVCQCIVIRFVRDFVRFILDLEYIFNFLQHHMKRIALVVTT